MLVGGVVGEGHAPFAVVLQSLLAARTLAAGIHEATHAHDIARLELADRSADASHTPDDLVPGDAGVRSHLPFVAGKVQIGVADAAEENVHLHIGCERFTPRE